MIKNIQLFVMDVDGVLTDGSIAYDSHGGEIKVFNARDGLGLKQLAKSGIDLAIISGRSSKALEYRAQELHIEHLYMAISDKLSVLTELSNRLSIPMEAIAYIGDDLPDLPCLKAVGYPMAVSNADPTLKTVASLVTTQHGGRGAVREACDWILNNE